MFNRATTLVPPAKAHQLIPWKNASGHPMRSYAATQDPAKGTVTKSTETTLGSAALHDYRMAQKVVNLEVKIFCSAPDCEEGVRDRYDD